MAETYKSGVFPVHKNELQIKTGDASYVDIAGIETIQFTFTKNIETYYPFEAEGWQAACATGIAGGATLSGKRKVGDKGNDALIKFADKIGDEGYGEFKWHQNGFGTYTFAAVVEITNTGGKTTDLEPMECKLTMNGKPEFSPEV